MLGNPNVSIAPTPGIALNSRARLPWDGRDSVEHFLQSCMEASSHGAEFPSIWHTIIKVHPLVAGLPIQEIRNGEPALRVLLVTGHYLVHGPDGYSLE